EHDFRSPAWRHWFTLFSRDNTLYRYDVRGTGLSDRVDSSLNCDRFVRELEHVVDAASLEEFALLGISLSFRDSANRAPSPARFAATRAADPRWARFAGRKTGRARHGRQSRRPCYPSPPWPTT